MPIVRVTGASSLRRPAYLAAKDGLVFVYDASTSEVVAFDKNGIELARSRVSAKDSAGSAFIADMATDPDGYLHVLDTGNRRISVLDAELSVTRVVSLDPAAGQPIRVLPTEEGYALYMIASDSAVVRTDANGHVHGRQPLPSPEAQSVHWVAREGWLLADAASALYVYAFQYGNGWLGFSPDGSGTSRPSPYWADPPFPQVLRVTTDDGGYSLKLSQGGVMAVRGAAVDRGCLLVVANDVGTSSTSTIDRFQVATGRYIESIAVPFWISRIAATEGLVFALGQDIYPVLVRITMPTDSVLCAPDV